MPETDTPLGGRPTEDRELRPQGRRTIRRLQDAARQVLAERGYHAMRVDDVVRRADTSHGTFYLYFANKEDLLGALTRRCFRSFEELAERLPSIPEDDSGRVALREWLEDFDRLYREEGPVIRAWLEAHEPGTPPGDAVEVLRRAFATRIRAAGPSGIDPEAAALALVAMIERGTYLRRHDEDRERHLDTLAAIAHRGVFAA